MLCRTDIYMYVIDGLRDAIITDTSYHKLDDDFTLSHRLNHTVVGITVRTYLLNLLTY